MLTLIHLSSLFITLGIIIILGWLSTRRVKNSSDFMVGNHQAGALTVTGILTGTLIGGVATIGTTQLGFLYGISAFWFTLILGSAVLVLGVLSRLLKDVPYNTVSEILGRRYGEKIIPLASLFVVAGMAINVASNLLAARSLLETMTRITPNLLTAGAGLIMIFYIIFGGIWSGSWIGLFKTALIYSLIFISIGFVMIAAGGFGGMVEMVKVGGGLNPVGRGVGKELAGGISLIIGVLSTQTYLQAIFSGKDVKTSRNGAFLAGFLIIPVGLMGFLVGIYMRLHHPDIASAQALPMFTYRPGLVG